MPLHWWHQDRLPAYSSHSFTMVPEVSLRECCSGSSAVLLPSDWLSISLTGGDSSTPACGDALCAATRTVPAPHSCEADFRHIASGAGGEARHFFAMSFGLSREAGFAGTAPIAFIFLARSPRLRLRGEGVGAPLCCAGGEAFSLVRDACFGVITCRLPCRRSFGVGGDMPSNIRPRTSKDAREVGRCRHRARVCAFSRSLFQTAVQDYSWATNALAWS